MIYFYGDVILLDWSFKESSIVEFILICLCKEKQQNFKKYIAVSAAATDKEISTLSKLKSMILIFFNLKFLDI